ncbi:toxin-antitoxin system HicB family antitoxin [Gordonia sp. CPCC 205333]|uniref:toxin-antitoxin system HicB family antitoxin n=1 Tax=Gordonia sp. CPCC 205333 TaxID=3140790 RepID=UPI003AF3FE59
MHLSRYVDDLRNQLAVAAAAGGDDARDLAERLTASLDAAARLVLLDALSTAAGEITSDLAPGSVEVRLRGRDPEFVVTAPPTPIASSDDAATTAARATVPDSSDDGTTARVTLRLPDHLKQRAEAAAASDGVSVNNWLVRAVATALDNRATTQSAAPRRESGSNFTGWVR